MGYSFVLRPGVRLMRSLDFSAKLVLLTSVAMLAQLVLTGVRELVFEPLWWLSGALMI